MGRRTMVVCAVVVSLLAGCSDERSDLPGAAQGEAQEEGAPPQKGFAYPQEELARMDDAPKISGTITVDGYTQGVLQIDVTLPTDGEKASARGVPPITVFRQNTPGPYELYLPPGTKAVNLSLILDLKGNGPDAEDPKLVYEKNPLEISGPVVSGVDMVIDSNAAALPPPPDAEEQPSGAGESPGPVAASPGPAEDALSETKGLAEPSGSSPAQDALSTTKGTEPSPSSDTTESKPSAAPPTEQAPSSDASNSVSTAPSSTPTPAPEKTSSQPDASPPPESKTPPESEGHGNKGDTTDQPAAASGGEGVSAPASPQTAGSQAHPTPDPLDESLDTVPK